MLMAYLKAQAPNNGLLSAAADADPYTSPPHPQLPPRLPHSTQGTAATPVCLCGTCRATHTVQLLSLSSSFQTESLLPEKNLNWSHVKNNQESSPTGRTHDINRNWASARGHKAHNPPLSSVFWFVMQFFFFFSFLPRRL